MAPTAQPRVGFHVEGLDPRLIRFTTAYRLLMARKLASIDFGNLAAKAVEHYKNATGKKITISQLWSALRRDFDIAKAGDQCWRFLYGRVLTGSQLHWTDPGRHHCPMHGVDLTAVHIWPTLRSFQRDLEAVELWGKIRTDTTMRQHRSLSEMVALAAISPAPSKQEKERWKAIYQTAIWCIWKAYLSFSWAMAKFELHLGPSNGLLLGKADESIGSNVDEDCHKNHFD
ncbi:uncharacterized protein N7515_004561 [Penicillium bovifimosum]|uniref:Uncharacterized protein n=1 Tax=Penicillium bovifimosum TaxID=126998 RepID=A0A9W9H0R0_9EURO|nr:uncharacterized protein N7515_004561 [Penicillium bovifimosum]KAJ5135283.1 hypothetical protein N7515_004561 [Penicillium bovifimosum]